MFLKREDPDVWSWKQKNIVRPSCDKRSFKTLCVAHWLDWCNGSLNNNNNNNNNKKNNTNNNTFPVQRLGVYRDHSMITR